MKANAIGISAKWLDTIGMKFRLIGIAK